MRGWRNTVELVLLEILNSIKLYPSVFQAYTHNMRPVIGFLSQDISMRFPSVFHQTLTQRGPYLRFECDLWVTACFWVFGDRGSQAPACRSPCWRCCGSHRPHAERSCTEHAPNSEMGIQRGTPSSVQRLRL